MKITHVDRLQFQQLDSARRIISPDHVRRFAIVDLDSLGQFGIGWQSDLCGNCEADRLEPIIAVSAPLVLIGIDQ